MCWLTQEHAVGSSEEAIILDRLRLTREERALYEKKWRPEWERKHRALMRSVCSVATGVEGGAGASGAGATDAAAMWTATDVTCVGCLPGHRL